MVDLSAEKEASTLALKLSGLIDKGLASSKNQTVKRIAFALAALVFAAGLIASFIATPDLFSNINWAPFFIVMFVAVPISIILSALEMMLTGKLLTQSFSFFQAIKISIIGGAANMLPLPGGTVVRVAALREKGASVTHGLRATILVGVIWLGVAFLFSGLWMLTYSAPVGSTMMLAGASALGAGFIFGSRVYSNTGVLSQIAAIKLTATVLEAIQIMLCLQALGLSAGFAVAATLSASGVVGSAVSIVPAGLGVREVVSATLASIIGLSAAYGFLAASLNRVAGLIVLCLLALILPFHKQKV